MHKAALTFAGLLVTTGSVLTTGPAAIAQVLPAEAEGETSPAALPAGFEVPSEPTLWSSGDCDSCEAACGRMRAVGFPHDGWSIYGGADYLLIRPHFSEAIGFVEATQTPASYQAVGRDLSFDYDSSFRVFAGAALGESGGEIRFTYTSLSGDTGVDGSAGAPGTFLVDPYGNVVGAAAVIDPHSRLFGQVIPGGDQIQTVANVDLNVFDLDFVRPFRIGSPYSALTWSAGARVADVEQFYASTVSAVGTPLAYGDFSVNYTGIGPRLGLRGDHLFGDSGFSLFADGHGSLLVGEYEVRSSNTLNVPATFRAGQDETLTRLVPVLETEIGAAYRISDNIRVSAGWMFQAWFDMGTSGGTFGGFFAGADDANIMSFDGLMLRTEIGF